MTRYIIVGAGGVGATLAAHLHEAGIDHVLVGRGPHIEAIGRDGLRFVVHGEERRVPVVAAASSDDVALTAQDVLVFATKTQDLEAAAKTWAWHSTGDVVGADLVAVSLQNGLAADRILARRFDRVVGGTILTPARFLEPGQVVSGAGGAPGVITLGAVPSGRPEPLLEEIVEDLREASYLVEAVEDVRRWQGAKILWSVRNGIEVLGGDEDLKTSLGDAAVAEARRILEAEGIVPAEATERTIDLTAFHPDPEHRLPAGQQSTWQSFARGASSEVDHLNGEIAALGVLHRIPTPANRALQRVLGLAERRHEAPGTRDVATVTALLEAALSVGAA